MLTTTKPGFQERCARWLLLLTFLHTIPVVWLTPVAGGTVPTAVLLAYGVASLFTFDHEGIALGLMALLPALAYSGIGWGLAWLIGRGVQRIRQPGRALLIGALTLAPLVAVYFPIYIAGGHNSSRSATLIEIFGNTISGDWLLGYWLALHVSLAALFAAQLLPSAHPLVARAADWSRPILATAGLLLSGVIFYHHYDVIACRPFAELGLARAQVCVAKQGGVEQRYWYERAAHAGDAEAIAWLIDKTPNRKVRLEWLRKGAEDGDPASQFGLYQFLVRYEGPESKAEAERLLLLSAEGGHAEAQMEMVEQLSRVVYRTGSRELLAERNAWLDRAAAQGSRTAKLRLARHYTDGGMGYPADLERARALYGELTAGGEPSEYERRHRMDATTYAQRLIELKALQEGLDDRDPAVMRAMAKRYLASQLPGPGVRELGLELMEELAAGGDQDARDELIVMLRTGSGGADKDLDAAREWLLKAGGAGDSEAMERLAGNYMSGREGFPIDYPEARRWIEALIGVYSQIDDKQARARVGRLENDLAHIDRLGKYAGGPMLGSRDLDELGKRTDADSLYEHAIQLLVGHGSKRRAEAIAELREAGQKGSGEAAWRLVQVYERGFPQEIDKAEGLRQLELAAANHHFYATRELAMSYEYGKRGLAVDLPRAIALYEGALEAGHDNRYGWDLDPNDFNHYRWLESRLRQARLKQDALAKSTVAGR